MFFFYDDDDMILEGRENALVLIDSMEKPRHHVGEWLVIKLIFETTRYCNMLHLNCCTWYETHSRERMITYAQLQRRALSMEAFCVSVSVNCFAVVPHSTRNDDKRRQRRRHLPRFYV